MGATDWVGDHSNPGSYPARVKNVDQSGAGHRY